MEIVFIQNFSYYVKNLIWITDFSQIQGAFMKMHLPLIDTKVIFVITALRYMKNYIKMQFLCVSSSLLWQTFYQILQSCKFKYKYIYLITRCQIRINAKRSTNEVVIWTTPVFNLNRKVILSVGFFLICIFIPFYYISMY